MDYQIRIEKLTLKDKTITIKFSGYAKTKSKLARPKWILYFVRGNEDRRIPLVIDTAVYQEGSWYFGGTYEYLLDCLFWKIDKQRQDIQVYLNCQMGDYYEEKISQDLTPEELETDSDSYLFQAEGNTWRISVLSSKKNEHNMYRPGKGIRLYRGFSFVLCLILSPWFFATAALAEKGYVPYASVRARNSRSPKRRIAGDINARIMMLSGYKISPMEAKVTILNWMFWFAKHRKIKTNSVGFISVRRNDLSGNMEFVYEKLKEKGNLDFNVFLPGKEVAQMSLRELHRAAVLCAVSKVIILDEYTSFLYRLDLKPETKVFQLWHACGAFKTFGYTRLGKPGGTVQESPNHKNYDYVTVSSENVRIWYAEGFGIPTSKVYATGVPRTDIFFDEEYKKKAQKAFFEKYPACLGKKIILFAPTFRGNMRKEAYYPMKKFPLDSFLEHISKEYMVIIKHHPFIREKHPVPEKYQDRVLDLSAESELNDLLFITDLIITDYSSLVFEASLLNLPMLFYTFDLQEYIEKRDFYFNYKSFVPGKLCYTFQELVNAVVKKDFEQEKVKTFAEKYFDRLDGNSSQRVADLVCRAVEE